MGKDSMATAQMNQIHGIYPGIYRHINTMCCLLQSFFSDKIIKRGYSPSRLKADGITVYTIKPERYEIGIDNLQTPFGHTVPVYNMERTICDLIRCRSNMEIQTLQGALRHYVIRKDKNLRVLMNYAELFHVEKALRKYLEVLL